MGYGGMIVVAVVAPARKLLNKLRELMKDRRCVDCQRKQGSVNDEQTFRGPMRLRLCGRCHQRYLDGRAPFKFDKTKRARYDAALIRRGKIVPNEMARDILEHSTFRRAQAEAQRG